MLKKLPVQPQLEMFKTVLASFINPKHELCLLAKEIDWEKYGVKERRNTQVNFSLDLPGTYFASGKYPSLEK
jgi:hypothetical protein